MGIAAGSLLALANRVFGTAFLVIVGVITSRALSVEDRGIFIEATVFVGIVGSLAASFSAAAGYFVSNRGMAPAHVAANSLVLSTVAGVLGMVAFVGFALLSDGRTATIALLAGLSLFPMIAKNALSGVLLGTGALIRYGIALYGQSYAAVVTMLAWVVLLDHRTVEHALGAWLVAQYVSFFWSLGLNAGWLPALLRRPDFPLLWRFITFGSVTGLAGVISFLNYRVDQLLVNSIDGDFGGGIYGNAVVIAEGVWLFSTAIAIASYARVGSVGETDAALLTARAVRHTWIIAFAGMVAIMLLANVVILLLFGSKYDGAENALRILSIGTMLYAPQAIISNYFTVALGRPSVALLLASMSLVLGAGICLLLIPPFGYIGGAWATTISYGLTATVSTAYFIRRSKLPPSSLFRIQREDLQDYARLGRSLLNRFHVTRLAGVERQA